jgi:hypothetical protein
MNGVLVNLQGYFRVKSDAMDRQNGYDNTNAWLQNALRHKRKIHSYRGNMGRLCTRQVQQVAK